MINKYIEELFRVNHAGEFGAKRIYSGQISFYKLVKNTEMINLLSDMKESEEKHYNYFNEKILEKKISPTILIPFYNIAGFALGFVTAACGKKLAMATTIAIEETIDDHYQEQIDILDNYTAENYNNKIDEDLLNKIKQFQSEELEHRDIAVDNQGREFPFYKSFNFLISNISKIAIFISKKI